jgi:hypothetical protein
MDDLESVIVSVSGEVAVADSEKWFEVLTGTYDEIGEDWSAFRDALPARAEARSYSASVTESFVLTLNDVSSPAEVLRQLSERRDQLPDLYGRLVEEERQALAALTAEQTEQAEPVAAEQAEPVAEWDVETGKAWYDDLTSDDSAWSGDEAVWDQFVTYFLYRASLQGVADSAQAFLDNILLFDDKVAGFTAYGITIVAPAADEPVAAEPAADEPEVAILPAAVSGDIADQVMSPAITHAIERMTDDGDFSADDILQVLDEAGKRIANSM